MFKHKQMNVIKINCYQLLDKKNYIFIYKIFHKLIVIVKFEKIPIKFVFFFKYTIKLLNTGHCTAISLFHFG